jgi:hypothetical protein
MKFTSISCVCWLVGVALLQVSHSGARDEDDHLEHGTLMVMAEGQEHKPSHTSTF